MVFIVNGLMWVCCFLSSSLYLNLVLGNVNVTLLSNQAKWVSASMHVRLGLAVGICRSPATGMVLFLLRLTSCLLVWLVDCIWFEKMKLHSSKTSVCAHWYVTFRALCFLRSRFAYKDEYEKFKLYLTIILLLGAVACRFILHYR